MSFKLTSAKVLGDGLTVRMQFEAGVSVGQQPLNRINDCGFFDYLPGKNSGLSVSVNGQQAEVIGVQAEDWNMPLPWADPPYSGGNFVAGNYYFLIAIADQNGNEIFTGPPIYAYGEQSGFCLDNKNKVLLNWRVPVQPDQSVNIYACTSVPIVKNLALVANVPFANLNSPTSYILDNGSSDVTKPWSSKSVTVTVTCLLATSIVCGNQVSINAPANIVVDENGLGTEQVVNYNAVNLSVVNNIGFLATDRFTFTRSVYISYSHGVDSPDAGTMDKPFKTKKYADTIIKSDQKNVRFAWLRGDVWPADPWITAHWGTGISTPTLYESYWNPAYGNDPHARPVLQDSSDPDSYKNGFTLFGQGDTTCGGRALYGGWPYQYFRGLEFRRDTSLVANTYWVTNTPNDFVVLSDCIFQNFCLVGSYGSAQHIAPIGCMFHRTLVHSSLSSPTFPAHVQGFFAAHCGDWLFSQSQFVKNGWKDLKDPQYNDIFNHNVYLSAMSRQVVAHGCYFFDGGLSGMQMRGGGVAAYNVFAGNPSNYNSDDTHMCYKNLFFNVGLYNHIVSPGPSYGYVGIHDFNFTIGNSGIDQTRKQVANFDGIYAFLHDSGGPNYPAYIAVRHETTIDAGGIGMNNHSPTKKAIIDHNLVINRIATGVDYKNNPLMSAAIIENPVPVNKLSWNYNAYQKNNCKTSFKFGNQYSADINPWQSIGLDVNSVVLTADPTFASKNLPDVNYVMGLFNYFKSRAVGSWSGMYNAYYTYNDYVAQYTPTNIPAIDKNPGGYYGAKDYR